VRLISDGDVAGVIYAADPDKQQCGDLYEYRWCSRGRADGSRVTRYRGPDARRLVLDTDEKRERAAGMGISNPQKIFLIEDMVRDDSYAATGVTDGTLVSGVKFRKHFIETETIVMRSVTGTVRIIRGQHRQLEKFHLD
jgi:fructose-1,6-bisphosphatase II / sedoheptulose-1,7-bisphosphatase